MCQSSPCPQLYTTKHIRMKTAFTNICEGMGQPQEVIESQFGAVIGFYLSNEFINASLVNNLKSNVRLVM